MDIQKIFMWLKRIVDYILCNWQTVKDYLFVERKGYMALANELAAGFVKQQTYEYVTDYVSNFFEKKTNSVAFKLKKALCSCQRFFGLA